MLSFTLPASVSSTALRSTEAWTNARTGADADTGTDGGADARAEPKVHKSFFYYHTFSLPGPLAIHYVTSSVYSVVMPCSY